MLTLTLDLIGLSDLNTGALVTYFDPFVHHIPQLNVQLRLLDSLKFHLYHNSEERYFYKQTEDEEKLYNRQESNGIPNTQQ